MRESHLWCIAVAATLVAAACSSDRRESAAGGANAADTGAPANAATPAPQAAAATFKKSGEISGLKHPESARYDPDLDVWFVSNINGNPLAKDNNGFISRVT